MQLGPERENVSNSIRDYHESLVLMLSMIVIILISLVLASYYKHRDTGDTANNQIIASRDISTEPIIHMIATPNTFHTNIRLDLQNKIHLDVFFYESPHSIKVR